MGAKIVSIIIPTCNRARDLAVCLAALKPQLPDSGIVEVLVLDDGASPESRKMVENDFPWAQWHAGPRRGPAANRNAGEKLACGEWLIFLDDDCIPRDHLIVSYLEAMHAAEGKNRCTLIGPTFSFIKERTLLWEAPYNPQGEALISCNFAIPRELFQELGGFDERFPMAAFEDTDFEARVRTAGTAVRSVPDAAVDHPLRRVPSSRKLALRWEARVISALDLGASPKGLLWRIPEHVFKVILSRFRGRAWTFDTIRAAARFAGEFGWMLWLLPGWIRRHAPEHRSSFWRMQVNQGTAPARYGL